LSYPLLEKMRNVVPSTTASVVVLVVAQRPLDQVLNGSGLGRVYF
jgi:hypothetical protein